MVCCNGTSFLLEGWHKMSPEEWHKLSPLRSGSSLSLEERLDMILTLTSLCSRCVFCFEVVFAVQILLFWALGFGLWALDLGFGVCAVYVGFWALGPGLWALGFGLWALGNLFLGFGNWFLARWAFGVGFWALGFGG